MNDDTQPATRGSNPEIQAIEIGTRYELRGTLGRGGMGEVRLAHDLQIEREVAVKLMHPDQRDDATIARFFREARVQGQLQHPAVVPVHDLGIDRGGNPYFVMKRLAGTTLAQVLSSTSGTRHERWTRRTLLARLIDVCYAIDFAHTRGIVHRDLKPANIMLGDFGEAYVLDWGLARVVGDSAELSTVPVSAHAPSSNSNSATAGSGSAASGATIPGQILGTPGYMSPEQIRGDADGKSDVYALGCILFEILADEPAMKPGFAALDLTLSTRCHRPSERVPHQDIPLELDDLCARATAQTHEMRPTARELAIKIQAYLDGDRDVERRHELADQHARRAQAAFAEPGDEARANAMREAGRAFALDPTNAVAQAMLGRLLLEAPNPLPADATSAADHERVRTRQTVLRWAAKIFATTMWLPLFLLLLPVHHAWPIIGMAVVNAAMALACWMASRKVMSMRTRWFHIVLALDLALIAMTGMIFGPLLLLPMFLIGSLAAWLVQPSAREIPIIVIAHALAFLSLIFLELTGVTVSTFQIVNGGLLLTPYALDLTPISAAVVLTLSIAAQFFNTVFIGITGWRAQEDSRDRLHAQSWHLRQLVPNRD